MSEAVLTRPTLVLNKHWTPIQISTVREAIGLVAKGAAVIIDTETYNVHDLQTWNDVSQSRVSLEDYVIRSSRLSLVAPEVIRLNAYDGLGERTVVFSRRNIFKRDRYTCQYCGAQPGSEELTIEHIMPKSRGGVSSWENCVLACVPCNKRKADRTPAEAGMPLRTVPKKPNWKIFAQVSPSKRCESWEKFISRVYWEIELEP